MKYGFKASIIPYVLFAKACQPDCSLRPMTHRHQNKRRLAAPNIAINVCTHLSAFNLEATKVSTCTSPSDRLSCESNIFCTWNTGSTLKSADTTCMSLSGSPKKGGSLKAGDSLVDICTDFCSANTGCVWFVTNFKSGSKKGDEYKCRAID